MTWKSLVPNCMVEDVDRTVAFYRETFGFEVLMSQPQQGPLYWAMVKRDEVKLMFQARASLTEELPVFTGQAVGGALTFYLNVTGMKELHDRLNGKLEFVLPWRKTWYGMNEFAVRDINGFVLMFAEQAVP